MFEENVRAWLFLWVGVMEKGEILFGKFKETSRYSLVSFLR